MSNRSLTLDEASKIWKDILDKQSPAIQAYFVYAMQTGIGGFPRDLEEERKISKALLDLSLCDKKETT